MCQASSTAVCRVSGVRSVAFAAAAIDDRGHDRHELGRLHVLHSEVRKPVSIEMPEHARNPRPHPLRFRA